MSGEFTGLKYNNIEFVKKKKLTMNERVRSGMPVNLTQASMTPCISAVMVEPMGVELIRDNNRKQKNMLEEKASTNNCVVKLTFYVLYWPFSLFFD